MAALIIIITKRAKSSNSKNIRITSNSETTALSPRAAIPQPALCTILPLTVLSLLPTVYPLPLV
jgi:hypothetical protein